MAMVRMCAHMPGMTESCIAKAGQTVEAHALRDVFTSGATRRTSSRLKRR